MNQRPPLSEWLRITSPFEGYTYSYPHKTSYRRLSPPRSLREVWRGEAISSLFLYLHIPFCEMRCGFCNLFTRSGATAELISRYMSTLARQARLVRQLLPQARVVQFALGGGTPTMLSPEQLALALDIGHQVFSAPVSTTPTSVETSPETATQDRLTVLADRGVGRVSIGIQSFIEDELRSLGRPQRARAGDAALSRIRETKIPCLNIDLIYGLPDQTAHTWLYSLRRALSWRPDELYLYPLYVRPMTGLARIGSSDQPEGNWDSHRMELYRQGRGFLLAEGYTQVSTRLFRRMGSGLPPATEYMCQEDGMVGLGCGARSYTRSLHYSDDWAVGAPRVKSIITDWIERSDQTLTTATYGADVNQQEQRTRYLLKSIFRQEGLSRRLYQERFDADPLSDWPEITEMVDSGFLKVSAESIQPTSLGFERADQLGPWLYSPEVQREMRAFEVR